MLPEGKMSSRKGNVVFFEDLKQTLTAAIESKMRGGGDDDDAAQGGSVDRTGWSDEQWAETVHRLAVACLRYGMLRSSNTTRVVFDADAWTNLTGDSGAYLLYSLARISGILRRASAPAPGALAAAAASCSALGEPAERMLLGHLLAYGRALEAVERTCDPSLLATWLYDGAKLFSRFYHDCPVLKAEAGVRAARLGLVTATREVMTRALSAIGIEPVDAM
jgi:arginyl-tRNA synthetase